MQLRRPRPKPDAHESRRRGTATVEFAFIAPLFLGLVLGIAEMGKALDVSLNMSAALREAGRLATMDYADKIPSGSTTNAKIVKDIRNMLKAGGLPGDAFTITVTHADGAKAGQTFNFDDPANTLQYFKLTAEIDYSDISLVTARTLKGSKLKSTLVFRMGKVSLSS